MDFLLKLILKALMPGADPASIGQEAAKKAIRDRMSNRIPQIVAAMEAGGFTNPLGNPKAVIRDALFRLWKTVVSSGTLADAIRDSQDDAVLKIVQPQVVPGVTLEQVVSKTMDAALEVTF